MVALVPCLSIPLLAYWKKVLLKMGNLFDEGVAYEAKDDIANAVAAYTTVLEGDPNHVGALINLGTIYYNRRDFKQAETHYRTAIYANPNYALAYFDLANVLDETGRKDEAILAYKTSIRLDPNHKDSHYNLAVVYEYLKKVRQALPHWRKYATMDKAGAWYNHALTRIAAITKRNPLIIAHSNPKPRRTKRRAKLAIC